MDMEAFAIVVDLLSQVHEYGESIVGKLELWSRLGSS